MTMTITDGPVPSSPGIKRIARDRSGSRVEKKENTTQLPIALALILATVLIGLYLIEQQKSVVLGINWFIGIALGLCLQRARFCFTASFRDPCLTGGTSISKAVVVGLAVGTVIFAALQLGSIVKTGNLVAAAKIGGFEPVGLHTAVGAVIFGIGAVIAGGCASGTLMRMGEGFAQQWIAIPFFVLGSALGAASWPVWRDLLFVDVKAIVYLPQILGGFFPALIVQFAALLGVWMLADWWSKRKASAAH